jgi:hypothetical protein
VLHEVVDLDDVRVLDLGEEPPLGDGRGHRVRVPGVEEALQHDPPVGDGPVEREVDPPEPAVGEAAEHLVLVVEDLAGGQLGREGEPVPARGAEALGAAGLAVPAAADLGAAVAAEALVLRHLRVGEYGSLRVAVGHARHVHQARAEPSPAGGPRRAPP